MARHVENRVREDGQTPARAGTLQYSKYAYTGLCAEFLREPPMQELVQYRPRVASGGNCANVQTGQVLSKLLYLYLLSPLPSPHRLLLRGLTDGSTKDHSPAPGSLRNRAHSALNRCSAARHSRYWRNRLASSRTKQRGSEPTQSHRKLDSRQALQFPDAELSALQHFSSGALAGQNRFNVVQLA